MSVSSELPLPCPTCGETCGFGDPLGSCQRFSLIPRETLDPHSLSLASEQLFVHQETPIAQPLELLDPLRLAPESIGKILIRRDSPVLALTLTARDPEPLGGSATAVAQLGAPWLGRRLSLEARLQHLALEVHHRFWIKLDNLQQELKSRSREVQRARKEADRIQREKQEAEERANELERQVDISVEMLARLRHELRERDRLLQHKEQEVCELDDFVRDTALREANAKLRLQRFIEDLLERAERAETLLQNIHSDVISSHAGRRAAGYQRSFSVSGISRRSYVSEYREPQQNRFEWRQRTFSVGSGGCEPQWDAERRESISQIPMDEDSENWSIYSEAFSEEALKHTGDKIYSHSGQVSGHGWFMNRVSDSSVCSELLRLKAALFCVCKDWRSVARHPAVWTKVTLENARFLQTLSQWCSQTQSLVLHNLKARARNKKESKDEYLQSNRGGLEAGLEALLKSAGRSLITLSISDCPNILTDRCLWLVSCHCRSLQSLTYRSAWDPVGQEVMWALGAGCRHVTTLRVAPSQPCLQPGRFGNRCLQMIGRCWPNLCRLGVGGASCGVQGLAALVRKCVNLCVLELHDMNELNQEAAQEICRFGLKQLHTLCFNNTPVTARALLHFTSVCPRLKCVVVQLSITDYFEDDNNEEAKRLFGEIVNNLQMQNTFYKTSLDQAPGHLLI
ncbi:hypothetical protein DNTS_024680 [Danionella cerebrum]|uniref:F-box domain-containing protein n=1 Tax=Danionella cerebrum TaxID=2873325 RepID=A0A553MKB5_9TELE|nr:hypothetical protein DNTS_024680 [Danionella translucida]